MCFDELIFQLHFAFVLQLFTSCLVEINILDSC